MTPSSSAAWETREPGSPFELASLNMTIEGSRAPELIGLFGTLAGRVEFHDPGLTRQAMDIVMGVSAEAVGQRPGFISFIGAQLMSLCICLWRSSLREPAVPSLPHARVHALATAARVHAVREYIWQNLGHALTLEAVADAEARRPSHG